MLLSLLADILAVDSLIRLWANPLPQLWWQITVMFFGDFLLRALHKGALRRSGKESSSSQNLGLLAFINQLGLIGLGLASMLP